MRKLYWTDSILFYNPHMRRSLSAHTLSFLCPILIGLIALLLYLPAIHFPFISFDDAGLIVLNPFIRELSPRTLRLVFSSYDPELYIPLTFISYQVDYLIGGLDPSIYHVTNILLHAMNAMLVFFVMNVWRRDAVLAAVVALLFAVHPINTEAVAWASARKDLLSSVFLLLSTLAFLRSEQSRDRRGGALAIALFACALLAKVTVLVLPFVLLLMLWMDRPLTRRDVRRVLPFVALSVIFGIIALFGKSGNFAQHSLWLYPLLAAKDVAFSLMHILLPWHYAVLYPQTTPVTLLSAEFALPALVTIGLIAMMIVLCKRARIVTAGLAIFLTFLLPSFLTFSKDGGLYFASDRYAYVAALGIFFLIASGLRWAYRQSSTVLAQRTIVAACGAVLIGLTVQTYRQEQVWHDAITLFTHATQLYPNAAVAWNDIGSAYMDDKNTEKALRNFQQAISVNPHFTVARLNIANIYRSEGKTAMAQQAYADAIAAIDHSKPVQADDLLPYYVLGEVLDTQGKTDEALALYRQAVTLGPGIAEAHYNLGVRLHKYGKTDEAIAEYRRSIALDRHNADAHYYLAAVEGETGMLREARDELRIVLDLRPDDPDAARHLADLERMVGEE